MNLDDESLLTAYLDGELTPRELARVDAALQSDPSLVARLGELARVRELVAGLPHPAPPFDVSQAVVQRLASSRSRRHILARLGSRRNSYLEVALSAAAVFLAAGFVGYLAVLRDLHAPGRAERPATVAVAVAPAAPEVRPAIRPAAHVASRTNRRAVPRESDARIAAEDSAEFQAMIDSPNLKRVFYVVDAVGGHADERVGQFVDSMPRADSMYACLTIVPNVSVDAKHPGGAKVYAVALTEPELQQVRDELRGSFPGAVEESEPDPSVVTQLAEIGQVSVRPGTLVADLESPADSEDGIKAIMHEPVADRQEPNDAPEEEEGPTPEQLRSAPAPYVERRRASPSPANPGRAEAARVALERMRRNKANIVLIWVASR